ncbi:MAG: hypothetical protein F4Y76_09655 [Acidimicrobiales bacterium]|nr:hypothetical protein [Acidimicrobiaceae bacterium]MDE0678068.1 hypothetical protein [Acidimicrobiaceae bacterium]MXZ15757.1 hypothetical protein [Acidimicrobiales bacterium]MYG60927.1 hypothetical protein [Acidimicrobiales bacterium]
MIGRGTTLLADAHASVPSEAVGSGLGVWWLLVVVLGLLTVACGSGFVVYLRRTAPQRWQGDVSTAAESS